MEGSAARFHDALVNVCGCQAGPARRSRTRHQLDLLAISIPEWSTRTVSGHLHKDIRLCDRILLRFQRVCAARETGIQAIVMIARAMQYCRLPVHSPQATRH